MCVHWIHLRIFTNIDIGSLNACVSLLLGLPLPSQCIFPYSLYDIGACTQAFISLKCLCFFILYLIQVALLTCLDWHGIDEHWRLGWFLDATSITSSCIVSTAAVGLMHNCMYSGVLTAQWAVHNKRAKVGPSTAGRREEEGWRQPMRHQSYTILLMSIPPVPPPVPPPTAPPYHSHTISSTIFYSIFYSTHVRFQIQLL